MYGLYREQVSSILILLGLTTNNQKDARLTTHDENHSLTEDAIERAYWHLAHLGNRITHQEDYIYDEKLKKVFEALATVPEFFKILNDVVNRYQNTTFEDSLKFVYSHPYMLNTTNRLKMGKQRLLSHQLDYPILSEAGYTDVYIELTRHKTWKDFVETISTTEGFLLNSPGE